MAWSIFVSCNVIVKHLLIHLGSRSVFPSKLAVGWMLIEERRSGSMVVASQSLDRAKCIKCDPIPYILSNIEAAVVYAAVFSAVNLLHCSEWSVDDICTESQQTGKSVEGRVKPCGIRCAQPNRPSTSQITPKSVRKDAGLHHPTDHRPPGKVT